MFHVLICLEVRHVKKYLCFILKISNCHAVVVLLIQMHHKIKNYLWWGAINIIAKCEKTCRGECFFVLRSYRVAASKFIKNKAPSQVFFTVCSKISGSLWWNMWQLSNRRYLLFLSSLLSINGLYSWLSAGKIIFMAHIAQDGITFHTPFPNRLWIHQL